MKEPEPSSDFGRVIGGLSWTLLGEVGFAAAQFGLMIVFARMGSEAALGRYALGLAIATPLFVLTSLHLRPTYVVEDDARHGFADFLGLRLIGAPLACILALVWSVTSGHDEQTTLVVGLVALTRLSEMIADICHAAALREEKMRRVGISRASRGAILIGSVTAALAMGQSEATALACAAAGAAMLTVVYDLPTARRFATLRPRFEGTRMRSLALLAAPVGLAGGLLGLTMNTPTYVLERVDVGGVEVVGRYAAVISVVFISGVLNAAMGSAAVPRLARLYPTDRSAFRALLRKVVAVIALAGLCILGGCWLLGEQYLSIAYGPSYASLSDQLLYAGVVVVGAGVANLLSQTLVAMRRFRLQFAINACTFVGGAVASLLLIPDVGINGALTALGVITVVRLAIYGATITVLAADEAIAAP